MVADIITVLVNKIIDQTKYIDKLLAQIDEMQVEIDDLRDDLKEAECDMDAAYVAGVNDGAEDMNALME